MPNWCSTIYKCVGNKEDVSSLYNIINDTVNSEKPIIENDFGSSFLGCVISKMGFDYSDYYARGWIDDYYIESEDCLVIYQSTAWCEQKDFRKCIEEKFPGMKVYYIDEEGGCCNYTKNDDTGKYFPEKYQIEINGEVCLFNDIESLSDFITNETGISAGNTIESILNALDKSDIEDYSSIHEYILNN